jgi:GNAT superfamily N-acetyltransferase
MQVVLEVFPSMWNAPEGRLPLPEADERSLGCHAVGLNGWADHGKSLIFQNSYGPDWGNNGSGVLTKEYADLYLREAWTERIGACGPNSENWEAVMTAIGFDLAKAWTSSEKAVMGSMRVRRRRFDYRYYPVVAFSFGCVVEVIEIRRRGEDKREGWAHLYHFPPEGERRSVLRELFVIPEARRHGVGTALERFAKERAVDRAADVLQIDLNEADAYGASMEAP